MVFSCPVDSFRELTGRYASTVSFLRELFRLGWPYAADSVRRDGVLDRAHHGCGRRALVAAHPPEHLRRHHPVRPAAAEPGHVPQGARRAAALADRGRRTGTA